MGELRVRFRVYSVGEIHLKERRVVLKGILKTTYKKTQQGIVETTILI